MIPSAEAQSVRVQDFLSDPSRRGKFLACFWGVVGRGLSHGGHIGGVGGKWRAGPNPLRGGGGGQDNRRGEV